MRALASPLSRIARLWRWCVVPRERRIVSLLAVFVFCNACVWSLMVIEGHAPDEQGHFAFAHAVAYDQRIPELGEPGFGVDILHIVAGTQPIIYPYTSYVSQPPLPYLLAAPWIALPTESLWMDYHQARVPQALLMSLFVVVVFGTVKAMFPRERYVPLATAVIAGLWPEMSFLASYLNADMAAIVTSALILWVGFVGARRGWPWKLVILLGVMMGLGLLSKLNVWPVVLWTGFLLVFTANRSWRGRIGAGLACTAAAFVVVLPWLAMLFSRYGLDIFATQRRQQLLDELGETVTRLDAAHSGWSYWHMLTGGHWLEGMGRTFVLGVPGVQPSIAEWGYPALIGVLALVGLLWFAWTQRSRSRELFSRTGLPYLFAILLMPIIMLIVSRNAYLYDIYFLRQGRYLYPALVPFLGLAVFGISRLVRGERARLALLTAVVIGFIALHGHVFRKAIVRHYATEFSVYVDSWQVWVIAAWVVSGVALLIGAIHYLYTEFRSGERVSSTAPVRRSKPVTADV